MKNVPTFENFLNLSEAFKVGDTWEWHGAEWDPAKRSNTKTVKQVEIVEIKPNNDVVGRFVDSSEMYIIREPKKYLKKKVNESIDEGYISDLHIMAQEAKDFNDFVKAAKKEYPKITKDKNVETWLKSIYDDAMNESMLAEGKISFDKMTFTVTTSSSNRGMILQFIPDSKTLDFPKQEQADAIMQRLTKKSPELAKLMWYDSGSYSAGISFAIDQYAFAEYIEKILK
jgi:hypothetical protein